MPTCVIQPTISHRTVIKLGAYALSAIYTVVLFLIHAPIPSIDAKLLAAAPTAIIILFGLFDAVLWRRFPIRYLIRNRLQSGGTWVGLLDSSYSAAVPIALVIRQTFTTINIQLISEESRSRSLMAEIIRYAKDDFAVQYIYQSQPRSEFRANSSIHFGGSTIEVTSVEPRHLRGEYWTDRSTNGSFTVERRSTKIVGSLVEAQSLPELGGS